MRNYFTIENTNSTTFGVYISGQGTFKAPARSLNMLSIPGKDGDLIGFGSRLENGTLTYPAFIYANFDSNIAALRAFLQSMDGYKKLVDTYHPNEYRMVYYSGPFEPSVENNNKVGSFDITFGCKPQRYLTSGDTVRTFTAAGTINNPTRFNAKPLIRVYGTGTVGIGSQTITISQADSYTDIDCEMMECFKGAVSKNQYVSFSGYDFPELKPGNNGVTLSGVTRVEITPRWWTV